MKRARRVRLALGLTAAALAAACSAALDHPTEQDAEWASTRWPATSLADLDRGRALYVDRCAGCHNLHLPVEHSPQEWESYVAYMVANAKLTPEEQTAIARYLCAASARARGMELSHGASRPGGP